MHWSTLLQFLAPTWYSSTLCTVADKVRYWLHELHLWVMSCVRELQTPESMSRKLREFVKDMSCVHDLRTHAWEAPMSRVGQNHIYTVYTRFFCQRNHQIHGVYIRFWPTLPMSHGLACVSYKHNEMWVPWTLHDFGHNLYDWHRSLVHHRVPAM